MTTVLPAAYTKTSALGVEEQRVTVRGQLIDESPDNRRLGDRYRIEARVVTGEVADVLRVPAGALFRRGGEWMTFKVFNGRAELAAVGVGLNNGEEAEIMAGLSEGEAVIVYPPALVKAGIRIEARANN